MLTLLNSLEMAQIVVSIVVVALVLALVILILWDYLKRRNKKIENDAEKLPSEDLNEEPDVEVKEVIENSYNEKQSLKADAESEKEVKEISPEQQIITEYQTLTRAVLLELARSRNLKVNTRMTKAELVEVLEESDKVE